MPDSLDDLLPPPSPDFYHRSVTREFLIYAVLIVMLGAILLPTIPRDASRGRPPCLENLQVIGVALQNYEHVYGQFPPAFTVDQSGMPLHSWRTLILPFLGEGTLYNKIDLTKSWVHPVNEAAFRRMPKVYDVKIAPSTSSALPTLPSWTKTPAFAQFKDDRSTTSKMDFPVGTAIAFESDASNAVPWMSPRDSTVDTMLRALSTSGEEHKGGYYILMCDSS